MISYLMLFCSAYAELVEKIVAVVDDDVILLSEFKEALRHAGETGAQLNEQDVINGMINRLLLLKQAEKFNIDRHDETFENMDQEKVIANYIEKRIRSLIYVPFRDVENYYYNNVEKYEGRDFYDARKEIEKYLLEQTLEIKVQEHIDELREKAMIRIQLE